MASVSVDALGLRLTAPAAMRGQTVALQRRAEDDFLPAVLGAMQRRLERIYGPRAVIMIRRLSFRCALKPSAEAVAALAELLGEDLADQVQALALSERGTGALPQAAATVQIYRDAAHYEAAVLIAAAERRVGPAGDKRDFGRMWRAIARRRPAAVGAVLARCLLARKLDAVLARLAAPELQSLAAAIETAAPAAVARAVRRALERTTPAAAAAAPPRRAATRREVARPPTARRPPEDPAPPPPASRAAAPEHRGQTEPPGVPAPADRTAPGQEPALETPETVALAASRARPADEPPRPAAKAADGPAPAPDAPDDIEPPMDASRPEPAEAPAFAVFESRWCALLYLLNISRAVELPERLWQVGADEGDVLAGVFARLAGEDGDRASGVLSPHFPEPPGAVPALQDWAREELVEGVRAAAATLTTPTLGAEALLARIAAFEAWFGGGAQDVVGWLAACHLAVFEAMTGEAVAPGALAERLGVAGRIELDGETIRVVMPLQAIDIEVRRAGLDADPGWLAWLSRRMVFVFEDDAP